MSYLAGNSSDENQKMKQDQSGAKKSGPETCSFSISKNYNKDATQMNHTKFVGQRQLEATTDREFVDKDLVFLCSNSVEYDVNKEPYIEGVNANRSVDACFENCSVEMYLNESDDDVFESAVPASGDNTGLSKSTETLFVVPHSSPVLQQNVAVVDSSDHNTESSRERSIPSESSSPSVANIESTTPNSSYEVEMAASRGPSLGKRTALSSHICPLTGTPREESGSGALFLLRRQSQNDYPEFNNIVESANRRLQKRLLKLSRKFGIRYDYAK